MNNLLGFLRIPLVRFIGVMAILYFGLFSNSSDPNSLRNRLSKENVKKNLHDVETKSRFIVSNVKMVQEASKNGLLQPEVTSKISVEDIEFGTGDSFINCGSEAEISYGIFSEDGNQIKNISSEKITVGSNLNEIIEKNILGMRQGGIRNIKIPKDFQTTDTNIKEMLRFYNSNIRYQIYVLSFASNPDSKISCK